MKTIVSNLFKSSVHSVGKGILVAYGKCSCGEMFQLDVGTGIFKKSRVKINKDMVLPMTISTLSVPVFYLINDDFVVQVTVSGSLLKDDYIEDIKHILSVADTDWYITTIDAAVKEQEYEDICKAYVTSITASRGTMIPVIWYNNGDVNTMEDLDEEKLAKVFNELEEMYPSIELDGDSDKPERYSEVNIYNASFYFNRNHVAYNGNIAYARALSNVASGLFEFFSKNDFATEDVDDFLVDYSDTFRCIYGKQGVHEEEVRPATKKWEEPDIQEIPERKVIAGTGSMPMLDGMTKTAQNN